MQNLLPEPPPTLLPTDDATEALASGSDPATVAAGHPASSAAWAALARRAYDDEQIITAYAFARTGYHRGLDQLRRNGWKGHGPVPWSHPGNRGFLSCLYLLGRCAARIGETDEATRCEEFLRDCDPSAAAQLS